MLNPYEQYAQNQVNTAPPEELTLMLYKGAVKFILLGIKALDEGSVDETNRNILRAQDIYYELLGTLDKKYAISNDLANLYDFLINLLVQANLKKDKGLLQDALGIAKEFVETWEEAIKIYRRTQGSKRSEIV